MDTPRLQMKATSRKPHRKTRTGCRTCKQRKIKCDEERPQCENCKKHSVQCDYLLTPLPASTSSPGGSHYNANSPSNGTPQGPAEVPNFNSPSAQYEPPRMNMLDLELLHTFSTSTCLTLHKDHTLKTLWQVNVPKVGMANDFVMRGILAVAALHIAHFTPEKKDFYLSQAMMHHQSGLRVATSMLSNLTDENASALYIFSALTLFFAIASPRKPGDLLLGETGVVDWVFLLKGTVSIVSTKPEAVEKGVFGPMFRSGARRTAVREELASDFHGDDDPLRELRDRINSSKLSVEDLQMYLMVIDELRKSFAIIYKQKHSDYEPADVLSLLFKLPDAFVHNYQNRSQESLAIFAHFCVLLVYANGRWWLEGSGVHFLSQTYNLLDEEHRLWIRWPIEESGWVPNSQETKDIPMVDSPYADDYQQSHVA